jgi:hypothetical protein
VNRALARPRPCASPESPDFIMSSSGEYAPVLADCAHRVGDVVHVLRSTMRMHRNANRLLSWDRVLAGIPRRSIRRALQLRPAAFNTRYTLLGLTATTSRSSIMRKEGARSRFPTSPRGTRKSRSMHGTTATGWLALPRGKRRHRREKGGVTDDRSSSPPKPVMASLLCRKIRTELRCPTMPRIPARG